MTHDGLDALLARADAAIAANEEVLATVGEFQPRSTRTRSAEQFLGAGVDG